MLRGYLTGGLSGLVVSAVGLGTASLIAEQPPGNQPPQRPVVESPDIADAAEATEAGGVLPEVTADAGGAPAPSETPQVVVESGGATEVQTDTSPLDQPDAGEVTTGLTPPQTTDDPVVGASTDTPVEGAGAGSAPLIPDNEADIVLETTTPPPPEVVVVEDTPDETADGEPEVVIVLDDQPEEAAGDTAEAVDEAADEAVIVVEEMAGVAPDEAMDEELTDAGEAAPEESVAEESGADETDESVAEVAEEVGDGATDPAETETTDAGDTEEIAATEDAGPTTPVMESEGATAEVALADAVAEDTPETGTQTGAGDDARDDIAAIETEATEADPSEAPVMVAPEVDSSLPVTPSTDESEGDDGGSLIALQGDEASLPGQQAVRIIPTGEEEDAAPQDEEVQEESAAPPASALVAYAAEFDLPDNSPSMSVILVDDGSLTGGAAALSEVPFAVTVALDPAAEGAAERMAAYRAAGIEVMAMAGVPAGAQPTDVEVALEAGFLELPEAIGLLDIGQAGLQTDRVLAAQAMARLASDGRGFVTLSQGLNSGLRAADDADVPATTIYRDLDSNDQDARVIRRFLDQAAFRARQQGSVVLVARVRADTISALVLWHTANAGGEVVMAPVSAVLLAAGE